MRLIVTMFILLGASIPGTRAQSAGNAVNLSGNDFFRSTLWSNQLFDNKSFSFELWFNAASPGVLVCETDTADVAQWNIAFAEVFAGGVVKVGVPNVPTFTAGTVTLGTWNYLAIVYNQTNQTLSAYLNGAAAGSSTGNRTQPSDNGRTAVYPFGRGTETNLGGGNWFVGKMDEVRIWRTALDASQISNIWNHVLASDMPGLMALWHFDTTNGSLSPDSRSAANDPALYVPDTKTMPLVASTAPLLPPPPTVTTKASTVSGRSVTVQGSANPHGTASSVAFEWGPTISYRNATTLKEIGAGVIDVNFSETLTNLIPGLYHYRAFLVAGSDTYVGTDSTFVISGPTASTQPANISSNSAQLSGLSNPNGFATSVFFEWGPSNTLGNSTAQNAIGSGTTSIAFTDTLNGLAPGTYYYRSVAIFDGGRSNGTITAFTIPGPTASTASAIVTGNSAQLRGQSNPNGFPTSVFFEWGTSNTLGTSTTTNAIGSGTSAVSFSETLTGLLPGTYFYRAVAIFDGGRTNASTTSFTIVGPTVTTSAAAVTNDTAQLRGAANPQGIAVNGYFQWGPTIAYGNTTPLQSLGNGATVTNFAQNVPHLAPGPYHYRAVLTNATMEILGGDQTFVVPTAAGSAARLIGSDYLRTTLWSDTTFTNKDFTFELWFNATGPGILVNEADTANTSIWDYAFAEIFPGGAIKAGVPGVPTFTAGTVSFGVWHHLALVYNESSKTLFAYLDGQPTGSSTGDRTTPKDVNRTSIYCFGRGGQTNLGGGNWFAGLIDEVRIWRRPLSGDEIAQVFNKVINVIDGSLMANWHLDTLLSPPYLSPDASGKNNTAWHVPETSMALVDSSAPVNLDLRPFIVTNRFRNVAPFTAELRATVDGKGTNTVVYFEYGTNDVFRSTAPQTIADPGSAIEIIDAVAGLDPAVAYQVRTVASNALGVVKSPLSVLSVTPSWAGYAYHLVPNDYLRTSTNQNSYFPNKSITVELWFYPTKAGVLASETALNSFYDRAIIEVLPSGNIQAGFNGPIPLSLGDAVLNQWNHVALRYNSTNQMMDGFLNGVKSASRTGARATPADSGYQGQFAFGRAAITKLGTGDYFGGDLDEIRVWNIAKSDEDLSRSRFNLLAGDELGLVFDWRGNRVAGDPIEDAGPLNNNGVNSGADAIVSTAPLTFSIRRIGSGTIETQFSAKPGSTYRLEYTSDFATWTAIATNIAPTFGYIRLPQPVITDDTTKFFRIVAQ